MSTTFDSLGLPAALVGALSDQGIVAPFPIQETAIPQALASRDIQGRAPTGSGKTLAFGLPMLTMVGKGENRRPRALVLVPTRELAEQIRQDLSPLALTVDRRVTAVFGGVGYGPQKRALDRGVDVLVATPGRLEDLIEQRVVVLDRVEIAVVDEADRMADMGFFPAVTRILAKTSHNRQTLLFSATLDGDVAQLSRSEQIDPILVEAKASHDRPLDVTHHFWRVGRSDRVEQTARIVENSGRTLVFTRTRRGADRLVKQLGRADVRALAMHGGRSQSQRMRALKSFADGRTAVLVATDVAARGIHVADVDVVVHYDLAGDHKDYTHRSGRTARAGSRGTVISLVADGQEAEVRKLQRGTGLKVSIVRPSIDRLDGRASAEQSRPPRHRPRSESMAPIGSALDQVRGIFVGNLPWSARSGDLEALFEEHGAVESATVTMRGGTGRSKGYGFVYMPQAHAERAIKALHGSSLGGRRLEVRDAR